MGSKKRKDKNKSHSKQNLCTQNLPPRYPQYFMWIIAGGIFVLSLAVSVIAKYPVLFGVFLSFINGLLSFISANYIIKGDFSISISGKRNVFDCSRTWIVSSAILSALSVLLMYISFGVYPFGDLTALSGDMSIQYLPFAAARNTALLSGESLAYSDALGMGGNLWSVLMYTVSSPFMLPSILCNVKDMYMYMFIIQIIKAGAMGGAFAFFYAEKFKRNDMSICVFAIAYTLMGYSVSNMLNVIWTDCIIMLPLIVLGVERIIEKKSPYLYVICLSWAMITNYYITYMMCIYLVLYYAAYIAINTDKFDLKKQVKRLMCFAAYSLLSAGISAAVLIPSAFAISGTVKNAGSISENPAINYNPFKLAARFLWGNEISYKNDSLPNVYCSVFVLILCIFFVIHKGIPLKNKIVFSALNTFLLCSTLIKYTDFVWHGFHIPVGLPYRYSFLISFTMLIMASEMWAHIEKVSIDAAIAVTCGMSAVIFAVYFLDNDSSIGMLIVSLIFLMMYIALMAALNVKAMNHKAVVAITLAILFTEMTYNGAEIIKQINNFDKYLNLKSYNSVFDINNDLIDEIKVSDSDVYRIEDENAQATNQSVYMDYSSLSFFATPNNGGLVQLMDALGYANDTINTYRFNNYIPLSDSLFNLKYVMSADNSERNHMRLTDISNRGKNVYENTLALSRGFAVLHDLLDWDISSPNPFEVQNSLARLSSGIQSNVFVDLPESHEDDDVTGRFVIEPDGIYTAEYILPEDGDFYCFFDCMESDKIIIKYNDHAISLNGELSGIMSFERGLKGDRILITFYGSAGLDGFVSAAMLNDDALNDIIGVLSQEQMKFEEYSDAHFIGNITTSRDCLLFTSIPYDKGWSAYVNGERTELRKIGGGLIGLDLPAGKNRVEMTYQVPGLTAGFAISLISLAAFVIIVMVRRRKFQNTLESTD